MGFWGTPISLDIVGTDPWSSDRSTADTIQKMRMVVYQSCQFPNVIACLDNILRNLKGKPTQEEVARAIFYWIKNHVRFVEDETILGSRLGYQDVNQELLISPPVILGMAQPQGDCDCHCLLCLTLCRLAGVSGGLVTVALERDEPERWSHVYCFVKVDGRMIYLDCSHGKWPGWETNRTTYKKAYWDV